MSMPQGTGSGQPQGASQQAGPAGQQWQGGAPEFGASGYGTPGYGPPGFGGVTVPASQVAASQVAASQVAASQPVTRVTGRRIVQYIVDAIILGIGVGILEFALIRGSGGARLLLVLVFLVLDVAWYLWYWAVRPHQASGQTFGMKLLGLRVTRTDGGAPSRGQFIGRAILLIVDMFFAGLVGWITILCSRNRQRIGDHAAGTLVVRTYAGSAAGQQEYAAAGQARHSR